MASRDLRVCAGVNLASFDGNVTKYFLDQVCVVTNLPADILEHSQFHTRLSVRLRVHPRPCPACCSDNAGTDTLA